VCAGERLPRSRPVWRSASACEPVPACGRACLRPGSCRFVVAGVFGERDAQAGQVSGKVVGAGLGIVIEAVKERKECETEDAG